MAAAAEAAAARGGDAGLLPACQLPKAHPLAADASQQGSAAAEGRQVRVVENQRAPSRVCSAWRGSRTA